MKKKIALVCMPLALLSLLAVVVGYSQGYDNGYVQGVDDTARYLHLPEDYWEEVIECDKDLFLHINCEPGSMQSGKYVLEVHFAGKSVEEWTVDVLCSDGSMSEAPKVKSGGYGVNSFVKNGSIVSWLQEDGDDAPCVYYVGRVDGDKARGKVYVPSSTGWHESAPKVGIWTLSPVEGAGPATLYRPRELCRRPEPQRSRGSGPPDGL